MVFFFFSSRRRHTRLVSDWSSDVCSSDLCSGMAAWILRRAAPKALANLGSSRPVARDFVSAIERAPTARERNGWQRLRVADVMPGDLFAWRRPRGMPSKNTGHVGFVVEKPLPV